MHPGRRVGEAFRFPDARPQPPLRQRVWTKKEGTEMKEQQVRSAAGMLLGLAAGAAVGAAGVMAAVHQDPRGVRRAARKMAKGAEHAVGRLDQMANDLIDRF